MLSLLVSLSGLTVGCCIAQSGVLIPALEAEEDGRGGLRANLEEDGAIIGEGGEGGERNVPCFL